MIWLIWRNLNYFCYWRFIVINCQNTVFHVFLCSKASDVANFDGSSSLIYRLSGRSLRTPVEIISLKFKTQKNFGTLLHADRQRDHSLTLVLEKGRLLLYHQQGAVCLLYLEWANLWVKKAHWCVYTSILSAMHLYMHVWKHKCNRERKLHITLVVHKMWGRPTSGE